MEFDESAEREYARQYAQDLANEGQPKMPSYRISFEDAARSWKDPSVSNFPQQPKQASTSEPYENIDPELLGGRTTSANVAPVEDTTTTDTEQTVPKYARQAMMASFSMEEVNARLGDNEPKISAGPSEQTAYEHSGVAMSTPFTQNSGADPLPVARCDTSHGSSQSLGSMPYQQLNPASYPARPSQPNPDRCIYPAGDSSSGDSVWMPPKAPGYVNKGVKRKPDSCISPAGDSASGDPVWMPPKVPGYVNKSVKRSARKKTSATMRPEWSITAIGDHQYPLMSQTSSPIPPRGYDTFASEPQRPSFEFGPQGYHHSDPVPQPWSAGNGAQPPSVLSTNEFPPAMGLPMWQPMPSPSTAAIPATTHSVAAQRRPAWPASTSQGPVPSTSLSVFIPASPYGQAPNTGHAPAHGIDLPPQSYQAWPSNTSQYPGSVFPQNFVSGIPYQLASSTGFAPAHRSSMPPQPYPGWSPTIPHSPGCAETPQSCISANPLAQSTTISSLASMPPNPWDNEGQFENNIECCNLPSCDYRCPSDPCPSGCMTSCTRSETCGSVYECTSSCVGSSVPASQPLSRNMSMNTRDASLDPATSIPSPATFAYGASQLSTTFPHALSLPFVGPPQIPLPAPPLSVPAFVPPAKQCLWEDEASTTQICGMQFLTSNDLQFHLHCSHGVEKDAVLVCYWDKCKRQREPFQTPQKLRRHTYTHTGCKRFY